MCSILLFSHGNTVAMNTGTGIDEDATVEKADAIVKQAEGVTLEPAGDTCCIIKPANITVVYGITIAVLIGTGIEEGAIVEVPEGETSVAKKPAAATAAAATASSAATASGSAEMKRAVATGDAVTSEPIQAWSSDSMVHTKRLQQDKTSKKTKCTVGQRQVVVKPVFNDYIHLLFPFLGLELPWTQSNLTSDVSCITHR